MKRNQLESWAKKELDHINRALMTQMLTDAQRDELEDRVAALSELGATPWLPSDWGRRLIRTAPWLPMDPGSRRNILLAVFTTIASIFLNFNGYLGALVWLFVLSIAWGCGLSPRLNAESRYALSRAFSRVRK